MVANEATMLSETIGSFRSLFKEFVMVTGIPTVRGCSPRFPFSEILFTNYTYILYIVSVSNFSYLAKVNS